MIGSRHRTVILAGVLAAAIAASGAAAGELDYDTAGLDQVAGSSTVAGERVLRTVCADCRFERPVARTGDGARLAAVPGGWERARTRRDDKLPTASGWRSISLPPPEDEEIAMTLGVAIVDEQNVAIDSISQNPALRFPSKRLLAGVRVKLGRPAE